MNMNTEKNHHLDENVILKAVIDEGLLSTEDRRHLRVCFHCRALKEKTEKELARLGETAKALAPNPEKRPILPEITPKLAFGFGFLSKPALAGALAVVLVIAASFWAISPPKSPTVASNESRIETWEEEGLLMDLDLLAGNAMPGEYDDTASAYDEDFEEAFLDYIAPIEDTAPLSFTRNIKGGPLC